MLLALRKIVDTDLPIPIRIGVHRGSVFAGDIGPLYRRTYTVMGDAVNLSARLMAKAEPGQIYATADVLDRSNTLFENAELAPFAVKGKAQPIQAWSVGRAIGSRTRNVSLERLPLIGRDAELAVIREALASARAGDGTPDRDRRGARGRQDPPAGGAARGRGRTSRAARHLRGLHGRRHRTRSGASSCASCMAIGRDDPDAVVVDRLRARGDDPGARPCPVAAAARHRVRRRDRADARGRDARRKEPPPEAARDRRPVPRSHDARSGADRDRERAPHGRGVGRAAVVLAGRAATDGPGSSASHAARPPPGSRRPRRPR